MHVPTYLVTRYVFLNRNIFVKCKSSTSAYYDYLLWQPLSQMIEKWAELLSCLYVPHSWHWLELSSMKCSRTYPPPPYQPRSPQNGYESRLEELLRRYSFKLNGRFLANETFQPRPKSRFSSYSRLLNLWQSRVTLRMALGTRHVSEIGRAGVDGFRTLLLMFIVPRRWIIQKREVPGKWQWRRRFILKMAETPPVSHVQCA